MRPDRPGRRVMMFAEVGAELPNISATELSLRKFNEKSRLVTIFICLLKALYTREIIIKIRVAKRLGREAGHCRLRAGSGDNAMRIAEAERRVALSAGL